jgi:hypothetical protein
MGNKIIEHGQTVFWTKGDCYMQAKILKIEKKRVILSGLTKNYWMQKSTLIRNINKQQGLSFRWSYPK